MLEFILLSTTYRYLISPGAAGNLTLSLERTWSTLGYSANHIIIDNYLIGPFICSTGHRNISTAVSETSTSLTLCGTGALGAGEKDRHFLSQQKGSY